jgi:hypothetical protein
LRLAHRVPTFFFFFGVAGAAVLGFFVVAGLAAGFGAAFFVPDFEPADFDGALEAEAFARAGLAV